MERWHGKVAVVTGASSGIGVAVAKQLVQNGLIVIGLARRVEKMKDEMKDANGPGQFHAKHCDISIEEQVNEVFSWIKSTFRSMHILVNNAAVSVPKNIQDCPMEDLESVFVNVFGFLYCTKIAVKLMKENETEGHIINVNSILGHKVMPTLPGNVYTASKFAVTALSETLSNELKDEKIRVTSVSPGPVNTAMFDRTIARIPNMKNEPKLQPEDVSNSIMHALSAPPHVEINEITLQAKRT